MTITYPDLSKCGRLGNQLWQIASTIGIAHDANRDASFPPWDYQPYFAVPPELFDDRPGSPATKFVPHMDERAAPYLQDFNLWKANEPLIRDYFEPSPAATGYLASLWERYGFHELEHIISVHIRRGDNVTHPQGYHPLRSWDYYRAALDLAGTGDVVVFTDDWSYAVENFQRETGVAPAIIFEGVARPREYADRAAYENAPILDWIDLQLMAACDRHIISNSTYAWWGAYLSGDEAPIYPSNWFGRHVAYTDASLMFPDTWIQVDDPTMGGV